MLSLLKKYSNRNRKYFSSKNVLHEMNGVVLFKTSNAIFDFNGIVIDEIIDYCKGIGYKPDKIVFVTSYDIDVEDAPNLKMKMNSDSKIRIIEENGQIIALLCIGEWVSIKKQK